MKRKKETSSDLFLKYNDAETKDMCKQFLTLISGLLVISLTFSDKVVNFSSASVTSKWLIIAAWSSLLLSIIFCGLGLLFITIAAGNAVFGGNTYQSTAYKSYVLIVSAGALFILGLLLLMATAIAFMEVKHEQIQLKQNLVSIHHLFR